MRFILALALAVVAVPAHAQAPDAKPLTYDQVKMVAEGLAQLDGYDRLARDGVREFTVRVYFEFKKGLRALIADNIVKARPAVRDLTDKNNELVRQYAGGGPKVPDAKLAEFTEAQRKLLDGPAGVSLAHIKLDELDLDKNSQITGATLSLLDPILDK